MNERETQIETHDTEGQGMKWNGSPEAAEAEDTEGHLAKAGGHAPAVDADDVEGNAISLRRAVPDTAKPGRAIGSRH